MVNLSEIKKSFLVSLWFMFLTFPIMVIRVNPIEKLIEWRWWNMVLVGVGSFLLSFLWRYLIKRKETGLKEAETGQISVPVSQKFLTEPRLYIPGIIVAVVVIFSFPFIFSTYQVNIMTTALIYVVLGLGLNIVVGLAGLLDLGYVAFYAVGAYSYGLLNHHFGLGFWTVLPVGAIMGALFGIILGFPVLRLRGDYLARYTGIR
jgi:branched-chain amino acid transport system permease protein